MTPDALVPPTSHVLLELLELLDLQMQRHAWLLSVPPSRQHLPAQALSPNLLDHLAALDYRSVVALLNDRRTSGPFGLVMWLTRTFKRQLFDVNQFMTFDAVLERAVIRTYDRCLRDVREALVAHVGEARRDALLSVTRAHQRRGLRLLARLRSTLPQLRKDDALPTVVCAQYAPELQLMMLGLDGVRLRGPVLDVGCGQDGRLVRHLHEQDVQAFGVDRLVQPGDRLFEGDWHDLAFESGTWSFVVSHMAFSNHFRHHHRHVTPETRRYAGTYRRLLRSLQPGGIFAYTPSLPFVEALLAEDEYVVTTLPNADPFGFTHVTRLR